MFIARPRPGKPFLEGQSLTEHLENVAELSQRFSESFGGSAFLQAAGWLHDIGKAASIWQRYLNQTMEPGSIKKRAPIKHAAAGVGYVLQEFPGHYGKVMAYIIAGHHAGLPDGAAGIIEQVPGLNLQEWSSEGKREHANIGMAHEQIPLVLPKNDTLRFPPFLRGTEDELGLALPFWIRMLFSCLVDADCLDAESIANPTRSSMRENACTLTFLLDALNRHFDSFPAPVPGSINAIRNEILAACRTAARLPPGFFSLTAPTGSGKTLSGMLFALLHAIFHNKKRIILVIPYTSIIEQTAGVFKTIFGEDNVLEHHSGITADTSEEEPTRSRLAAENWDYPITVTTTVQFFESLYASRPSKCRKLHNLADAVIILDEAQLVPAHLLKPCVDALRQLVKGYNTTIVLATATQPAFPGLEAREIVQDPPKLFDRMKRTRFIWPETTKDVVTWPELATRLRNHKSFLCIVNTRRNAYDLWKEFGEDAFHLSTMMCPAHRRDILATIKERLASSQPVAVVSTQLVEAGVDIDFPVVYRALAGMDSLAQAAGRCNREGNSPDPAEVHIFIPADKNSFGIIAKGEDIVAGFLRTLPHDVLEKPGVFADYFGELYKVAHGLGEEFLNEIKKDALTCMFPFRTLSQRFRMIDEDTAPIIVNYGDNGKLMHQLRKHGPSRDLMRKAQPYIVSPPNRMVKYLESCGRIEPITEGLYMIIDPAGYNIRTGLDVWSGHASPETFMV